MLLIGKPSISMGHLYHGKLLVITRGYFIVYFKLGKTWSLLGISGRLFSSKHILFHKMNKLITFKKLCREKCFFWVGGNAVLWWITTYGDWSICQLFWCSPRYVSRVWTHTNVGLVWDGSWDMSCGYTLNFDDFSKNKCVSKKYPDILMVVCW
jgi:hypothetical protein